MKNTFISLCLSVCAFGAQAEWLLYGDNGKAAFYYDPASVNLEQGRVTVWEMLDYSFPLNRVLSSKIRKEFDCGKLLFRNLAGEFFAGQMLSGERISGSDVPDDGWRAVVQGTRNLELRELLCPKIS
ncbi:MAG: hypothetical protein EXR37_07315 [Limnohabitans sp.]|nr:hypothetical protein [Limnohabitans sp.]